VLYFCTIAKERHHLFPDYRKVMCRQLYSKYMLIMALNIVLILTIITIIESNNGQKLMDAIPTHIRISEIGDYCNYNTDCIDFHGLCVDNKCKCEPNFKLINGKCEEFSCSSDTECQKYDSNRECHTSYGKCVCKIGFNEFYYNQKCNPFCASHSDCAGINQVCVDSQCKCKPNYQLDLARSYCTYFRCHKNSDCWSIDNRRVCIDGECVCDNLYTENYKTMKCVVGGNSNSLLWILMAFVCVGLVLGIYYMRRRRYRDGFVRVPQNV
jgi:hypothetical protein